MGVAETFLPEHGLGRTALDAGAFVVLPEVALRWRVGAHVSPPVCVVTCMSARIPIPKETSMYGDLLPSDVDRTGRDATRRDGDSSATMPRDGLAEDEASPSAPAHGQPSAESRFGWAFRMYAESKPPGLGHLFIG